MSCSQSDLIPGMSGREQQTVCEQNRSLLFSLFQLVDFIKASLQIIASKSDTLGPSSGVMPPHISHKFSSCKRTQHKLEPMIVYSIILSPFS